MGQIPQPGIGNQHNITIDAVSNEEDPLEKYEKNIVNVTQDNIKDQIGQY